jgi:excisionase family DNA binding protein
MGKADFVAGSPDDHEKLPVVQATPETNNDERLFDNRIMHVAAPSAYDVFSEEEIARMLAVEPRTIRNLILRSRELTYIPIGKTRRILRKDLEAFLERRRVKCVEEISAMAKKG